MLRKEDYRAYIYLKEIYDEKVDFIKYYEKRLDDFLKAKKEGNDLSIHIKDFLEIFDFETIEEYMREFNKTYDEVVDDIEDSYTGDVEYAQRLDTDSMFAIKWSHIDELERDLLSLEIDLEKIIDVVKLFDKAAIKYEISLSRLSESTYLTFNIKDYDEVYNILDKAFPMHDRFTSFDEHNSLEDIIEEERDTFELRISCHEAGSTHTYNGMYFEETKYSTGDLSVIFN